MAKPIKEQPESRCLACRFTKGQEIAGKPGRELWFYIEDEQGRTGPFCTETCAEAWKHWPRLGQLVSIYPSYWDATLLMHANGPDTPARDKPGDVAYAIRWDSAEPVKHQTLTLEPITVAS